MAIPAEASPAAAPQPVSADGLPGSYTTERWSTEETLSPKDLMVANSTNTGTGALTGIVLDEPTGLPVVGATVSLESTSHPGIGATGTTDDDGAFSFINIWPETCIDGYCIARPESRVASAALTSSEEQIVYKLTVIKSGYGTYTVLNDTFDPVGYQTTVELTTEPQTFDESVQPADSTLETAGGSVDPYVSVTRVLPSIRVGIYPQDPICARAGSTVHVKNYPWRFYVLHVAVAEIDTRWQEVAWKAVGAAIQITPGTSAGIPRLPHTMLRTRPLTSASNPPVKSRRSGGGLSATFWMSASSRVRTSS